MNDSESMANAMRIGICSSISFETRGIDRFMIHTGFSFPDDDELHIILKRRDGGWILTDEGHTSMWVSYSVNLSENRRRLLEKVAGSNGIGFKDGVMSVDASVENAAGCLMSMIQAILQASELSYLTRSTVHNTFVEDTKQALREKLGSDASSTSIWETKRTLWRMPTSMMMSRQSYSSYPTRSAASPHSTGWSFCLRRSA